MKLKFKQRQDNKINFFFLFFKNKTWVLEGMSRGYSEGITDILYKNIYTADVIWFTFISD